MNDSCRFAGPDRSRVKEFVDELLRLWAIATVAWLCVSATLLAQDRAALVIANSDYGDFQYPSVKSGATLVRDALERESFQVLVLENIPAKEMKTQIEQFTRGTATRGISIIYFAGLQGNFQTYASKGAWWTHLQGAGKPADAKNPERESLAVNDVLKLMADYSASAANLLVLDAPAANPFLPENDKRPPGFVPIESNTWPSDVGFLSVSRRERTEPSELPLARGIAKQVARGRESIRDFLDAVVEEVKLTSRGEQVPVSIRHSNLDKVSWKSRASDAVLDAVPVREGERPGQQWTNSIGMVFGWCPPGAFRMGSLESGPTEYEDAAPTAVTLTHGFWIGRYEVTQLEADRMKAGNQRQAFPGKHLPLHSLQPNQIQKLLAGLTEAERKSGRISGDWEYALPSEAQWEYACRAGSASRYSFGDDVAQLHLHANFADKSLWADDGALEFTDRRFDDGVGRGLAVVGSYRPNAWGLHDMHGNVAEWCADRYLPQLVGGVDPLVDDKRKDASPANVIRGGAWCSTPLYCESGFRNAEYSGANAKNRDFIGFRVILKKK